MENKLETTKLVKISDIKKAIKLRGWLGSSVSFLCFRILGLHKINSIYSKISHLENRDLSRQFIINEKIKIEIDPEDLNNIPKDGGFAITCNHPFGGIDGIILYDLITNVRPDLKILTNFLLSKLPNLRDCFIPVNPFTDRAGMKSSLAGIRTAREHLENGGALGLFPSGEVSSYNNNKFIRDIEWKPTIIKMISNTGVPVLPIYFEGNNSKFFHFLGRIHPMLRTARLPRELARCKGKTFKVKIGKPINNSEIAKFNNTSLLADYLRSRTYALEALIEPERCSSISRSSNTQHKIAQAKDTDSITNKIESLPSDKLLFEHSSYQCYLLSYDDIPELIYEIARQREVSFRYVGEGTGNDLDMDDFDRYYKHLVLWDRSAAKVVGAYRLGIGDSILKKEGLKGFYTNTLFKFSDEFEKLLPQSIELGRSFISREYSKDPLGLLFLFKGLMLSMLKYPSCKYLFGPVSISSSYSSIFQSMITSYLDNFYNTKGDTLVFARTPFKPNFCRCDKEALMCNQSEHVDSFDKYLSRTSAGKYRLPALIKRYAKYRSDFLAFNVDKHFNYCVDGLVLLDISNIPKEEIEALTKGCDDRLTIKIMERFCAQTGS